MNDCFNQNIYTVPPYTVLCSCWVNDTVVGEVVVYMTTPSKVFYIDLTESEYKAVNRRIIAQLILALRLEAGGNR